MGRCELILMVRAAAVPPTAGYSGGSDTDPNSPEAVVDSFRQALDELDQHSSADGIINAVGPPIHSASPFPGRIRDREDPTDPAYIPQRYTFRNQSGQ